MSLEPIPTDRFLDLDCEQRSFWCEMAGAHPCNARYSEIAIDAWCEHGFTRERAILEFMAWLIITRESIGVQGYGTA